MFKNDVIRGVALGVSAALVALAAIPLIFTASRPFARASLKSGVLVLDKGRFLQNPARITKLSSLR